MINAIARAAARRRIARMRALASNSEESQRGVLLRLIRAAERTEFGTQHEFDSIRSIEEYQAAVPLGRYDDFAQMWARARAGARDVAWPGFIENWALSSGTTSGEKYLPVSRATIRNNRRGGFDSIAPALAHRAARLFAPGGKLLFLGGATALRREGPAWVGDNTGIMALHVPAFARRFHAPGLAIASESNWERKIERAAAATLRADIRMMAGVPSWLLLFSERVLDLAREAGMPAQNLTQVWPNLCLVVHGGVSFEPYRARFLEIAGKELCYTDTYSASEGGMLAIQDRDGEPGMLPIVDRGVFYEFIPAAELDGKNPRRVPIHAVEKNCDYAVAITSDSGIWSYLVGDLVRFIETDPLRLVFAGRIAHTLNAFGEHVSGGEIDRAVARASESLGLRLGEYSVAAAYPAASSPRGRHNYYCELEPAAIRLRPELLLEFADAIDRNISAGNEDYTAHRSNGYGLDRPAVRALPPGTFYDWMRRRGKLGGQNKVPRVLTPELEADLLGSAAPGGAAPHK